MVLQKLGSKSIAESMILTPYNILEKNQEYSIHVFSHFSYQQFRSELQGYRILTHIHLKLAAPGAVTQAALSSA